MCHAAKKPVHNTREYIDRKKMQFSHLRSSVMPLLLICESLSNQSTSYVAEQCSYFSGLDLADCCCSTDTLEVDVLVKLGSLS